MSQPSHEAIRRRFERDAQGFDAIYRLERSLLSRWFNTTFRRAIFERYDITIEQAGDVSGKAVLDIGCGPGIYSVDFARRGRSPRPRDRPFRQHGRPRPAGGRKIQHAKCL